MSYIEKFLKGREVEWKKLDCVFDIFAGGDAPRDVLSDIQTEEFPIPVFSNGVGNKSLYGWTKISKIQKPSLTISARGTIGWTSFQDKPFYPIVRLLVLTPKIEIDLKYSYYFMKSIENSYKVPDGGIPQLTKPMINETLIPVPPLEVQKEIVRILDKFTELTGELAGELTAELTARKKQYNYYIEQLLNFEEGEVEWESLGEAALKISSGGTPNTNVAEYWENGTIPWMSSGEVNLETVYSTEKFISEAGLNNSSAKFVPKNSIVIALAGQGKTRGKVARIRIDLTTNQSLASLTFNESKINPDYVFHFMKTQYENLRQISSGSGTRGGLNLQMISTYKIPIPSLEKQARIVSILDKFDILTTSISEGLTKEIELRKKQYEYYRDLLLTFPKNNIAS